MSEGFCRGVDMIFAVAQRNLHMTGQQRIKLKCGDLLHAAIVGIDAAIVDVLQHHPSQMKDEIATEQIGAIIATEEKAEMPIAVTRRLPNL